MKTIAAPTRLMLAAALACTAGLAQGQTNITPTGQTPGVVVNNATPGVTNITAPNNAVIEYSNFNVAAGDTVNFIQPGVSSRVLNRINSASPSQIDGNINANGIVYFINPAGVAFGPSAVVNVAGLYAAAGSMNDADFLTQNDSFFNVTGNVTNDGTINATDTVALVGQLVTNNGAISVPSGALFFLAGETATIRSEFGGLLITVDVGEIQAGGGVNRNGTENAGSTTLAVGDLASMAMGGGDDGDGGSDNAAGDLFVPTLADIDLNDDLVIDQDDADIILNSIVNNLPATPENGDLNQDGVINVSDLFLITNNFGAIIPTDTFADAFSLDQLNPIDGLPVIEQEVNPGVEAGLNALFTSIGILPRPLVASERIGKVQARALYNDLDARAGLPQNGALPVASVRLDADVVRQALTIYQQRIAVEGVPADERAAQIRNAVDAAYKQYAANGQAFDAAAFVKSVQDNNPGLINNLTALVELRALTGNMGLSDAEQRTSDRQIINSARPEALTLEQMTATLDAIAAI